MRAARAARLVMMSCALGVPRPARAQTPTSAQPAGQVREVRGTVSRYSGGRPVPVASAAVTLHRVGGDGAGPLDSTRTDARGGYRFRYRPRGDSAAVYFVSSRWSGIAYFTPPLRAALVSGDDANLELYDTTSAPIPIHTRSRHVIVGAPDSTRTRTVVEVFVISNDTTMTRIAAGLSDTAGATFEAILPDGAQAPRLGQSDVPPEGVSFSRGRMRVLAPIAPGMKRIAFEYAIPASAAPFELARANPALMLEVLVEDPRGTASGAGLTEIAATSVEGRSFRRFLAQNIPANAPVSITAPTLAGGIGGTRVAIILIGVGAAMLLLLGTSIIRRGPLIRRRARTGDPDALAREIAALDAAFDRLATPTADDRADHYERRARLKARLTAALAKRDGLV